MGPNFVFAKGKLAIMNLWVLVDWCLSFAFFSVASSNNFISCCISFLSNEFPNPLVTVDESRVRSLHHPMYPLWSAIKAMNFFTTRCGQGLKENLNSNIVEFNEVLRDCHILFFTTLKRVRILEMVLWTNCGHKHISCILTWRFIWYNIHLQKWRLNKF